MDKQTEQEIFYLIKMELFHVDTTAKTSEEWLVKRSELLFNKIKKVLRG